MRVIVCGTRGSTPAPGVEFARYGGNTSCVAVARDGEEPSLVLDAGTGLRRLSGMMNGTPFRGTILLGHLHWDHTHGIPFFASSTAPGSSVRVLMPSGQGDPVDLMARIISPPHFPVGPTDLEGSWDYLTIDPGEHEIEGFSVRVREIPHKGGRTYGFRVTDGTATLAYLSDHSPVAAGPGPDGLGAYHDDARALCEGADLLIHDAQHTAAEFAAIAHFGHSAVEYAIGLAEACGVGRVLLFHHDPPRTDEAIDAIVAAHRGARVAVGAAAEGSVLTLP